MNDIDNSKNSKKLYCSVWIEIKNWIELSGGAWSPDGAPFTAAAGNDAADKLTH